MRKPGSKDLTILSRELQRRRARAARLWRKYQAKDDRLDTEGAVIAHHAWSEAVDEALRIAEAMSRLRARSITDLGIQFEAIWWWIVEDESVLDNRAIVWLRRFRRSLRRLASLP